MSQAKMTLARLGLFVLAALFALTLGLLVSCAEAQNTVPHNITDEPCDPSTLPSPGEILAAHEPLYTRCLVWSPITMGAIWMAITIEHGYGMRPPIGTLWSGSNAYRHGEEWWYEHRGLPRSDRAEACLQNLVLATRAAHCGGPEH